MTEEKTICVLKVFIGIGLCLLLLGHYLIEYADLPEKMGVTGIIISATCIALGLVFSLPTKMYLTFLLVKREGEKKSAKSGNCDEVIAQSSKINVGNITDYSTENKPLAKEHHKADNFPRSSNQN